MTDRKLRPAPHDLADLVDRIARDIQSGAFAPGMWLKQIDLEQRYACTRPDVRRALDRLVEKRLVRHVPNRGYHVFEADGQQVEDVLGVRIILETAVADKIVANATPSALQRLTVMATGFDDLALTGSLIDLYEMNLAFHRHLLDLSGNAELVRVVSELRQRTSSAPATQWRTRARIEQSGREHHQMVAAIAASDVSRLRALIEQHIRQTPAS